MRILGVDPGLSITGYAVMECAAPAGPRVIEAGAIRPGRGDALERRLARLHTDLVEVIREFAPHRLVVEQIFVHRRHVRSAVQMGHARGVILLAAASSEIPVDEITPAEIKKHLTGHGRADKSQMQRAVMSACGLKTQPEPADVADAIAIALCGIRRRSTIAAIALGSAAAIPTRPASPPRRVRTAPRLRLVRSGCVSVPDGSPA
jgi:crossover junction endodeoxyribonuclease RuvC